LRINKFLSECGICSRREADRLIARGKITVNGLPAGPGMQVTEQDRVCLDGREVALKKEKTYLKFYKPRGIVCTSEKREKHNLIDYLGFPGKITYAGRLDRDSEGLLLLTDDGEMIDRLMRARNSHEKEYIVETDREVTGEFLGKMQRGIYLEELKVTTRPCRAEKLGPKSFRIVLTQGLNRQIRRMCGACGYRVRSLKRIRIANLMLAEMKPGERRPLTGEELQGLQHLLKGNDDGKKDGRTDERTGPQAE
jgi:23S rRNA pseudouridine2604 synthase